jgi:hypothetical protein
MTDLRIDDATTAGAVAELRAAANRLAPVSLAVGGLDIEVVGANALAVDLDLASWALAAALNNLGGELAGLATQIDGAAAGLASTDRALATQAQQ